MRGDAPLPGRPPDNHRRTVLQLFGRRKALSYVRHNIPTDYISEQDARHVQALRKATPATPLRKMFTLKPISLLKNLELTNFTKCI